MEEIMLYLFSLGVAWVPSTLIEFEMRDRRPTHHKIKFLPACGSKSLPQSATCVSGGLGKGADCN